MPARTHVVVHRERMEQGLTQAAVRRMDTIGRQVVNHARSNCPVDSGQLRSSITHHVTVVGRSARLRVGSPLERARYIHEGTGIYGPKKTPIVPVSAKALKFPTPKFFGPLRPGASRSPGGFVFAKSVKGIPPNPFLTDALKTVLGTTNVTVRPVT
ncbi:HK97 gp10 family phage protein [Rhodococcus erythropolis]|uniref:HK97 gp10 family phage protein n=1 Tax=Rhodococcus erythropolis TaxID=1833 RepID=UPI00367260A5